MSGGTFTVSLYFIILIYFLLLCVLFYYTFFIVSHFEAAILAMRGRRKSAINSCIDIILVLLTQYLCYGLTTRIKDSGLSVCLVSAFPSSAVTFLMPSF